MSKQHMVSVVMVSAAVWLAVGCTDDFSRFQFGQKPPQRPRDAGTQNVNDAGKDSGSIGSLPNMLSVGGASGRGGPQVGEAPADRDL